MLNKPKISRATVISAVTDGETLFLEVNVFDGEHTLKIKPTFPANTSAKTIKNYLKRLIEDSPKLEDEIIDLFQATLYWDEVEESWYTKKGDNRPVREKGAHEVNEDHKLVHHSKK